MHSALARSRCVSLSLSLGVTGCFAHAPCAQSPRDTHSAFGLFELFIGYERCESAKHFVHLLRAHTLLRRFAFAPRCTRTFTFTLILITYDFRFFLFAVVSLPLSRSLCLRCLVCSMILAFSSNTVEARR